MSKSIELKNSEIMNTIYSLCVKNEQLADKKKLLKAPSEDTLLGKVIAAHTASIKALSDESKAVKKAIELQLKGCDTVFSACKIVTAVCTSPADSDNAYRQKMSRRRNALKKMLENLYNGYDFRSDKIDNQAVIKATVVGCRFTRQANTMLAMLNDLQNLGYDIPVIERDALKVKLEEKDGLQVVYTDKPVDDNTANVADTLASIEAIMKQAVTIDETIKEEKKEKVA